MRARLVLAVLVLVALAFPVLAQDRRGGGSLDRVLPQIQRTVPGKFFDAEGPYFTPDGRAVYRVKWMTPDGRIIWFMIDAQSGQMMGPMPGRFEGGDRRDERDFDRRDWHYRDRGYDRHDSDRGYDRRDSDRGGWGNSHPGDRGGEHGGGHGNWGNDRGGNGGGWNNNRGGGNWGGANRGGKNGGHDRRPGG